jgi:hypothetical protein
MVLFMTNSNLLLRVLGTELVPCSVIARHGPSQALVHPFPRGLNETWVSRVELSLGWEGSCLWEDERGPVVPDPQLVLLPSLITAEIMVALFNLLMLCFYRFDWVGAIQKQILATLLWMSVLLPLWGVPLKATTFFFTFPVGLLFPIVLWIWPIPARKRVVEDVELTPVRPPPPSDPPAAGPVFDAFSIAADPEPTPTEHLEIEPEVPVFESASELLLDPSDDESEPRIEIITY